MSELRKPIFIHFGSIIRYWTKALTQQMKITEEEEDRWKHKRVNLLFHLPLSLRVHLCDSGRLVAVPVSQQYAFPLDSVTADCLHYTAEVYSSQTLVDLFQTRNKYTSLTSFLTKASRMWPYVMSNKMLLFFSLYGSKEILLLWKHHCLPTSVCRY